MKNVLFFLLSLISFSLFAQTSTVKGIVKDETSQKPLAQATVSIKGSSFTTTSDAEGNFTFSNVPYGNYAIEVKADQHFPFTLDILVNSAETVVSSINIRTLEAETERQDVRDKASVDEIPTTTVVEEDVKGLSEQSVAGALGVSRDPFITTTAIIMGSARFRIRGYSTDDFFVLMNGVPVNDLETRRIPTQSWSGLNSIALNREYYLGLGANGMAFGAVGGTFSLDTRASNERKGLSVSYSEGNRNFRNRLMATWSSGILKGGWALSASVSKRWATEGYVQGTFYDGYSYYLSLDKHFGAHDILSLSTYGAPNREAVPAATTQEAYDLAGSHYYNPGWGYQNGVERSAYVHKSYQPTIILNNEWKIDSKSSLMTAAGFSFGKTMNQGLAYYDATDPRPDYYKYLPSYIEDTLLKAYAQQQWRQDINLRQINWDNMYDVNRHAFDTVPNANGISGNNIMANIARYMVQQRVQDQKRFNFNVTYNNALNENMGLTAGAYYQFERSENYRQVVDLLGAQYAIDYDQYAPLTYPDSASVAQKDLNHPNRLLNVGDKFDYDYFNTVHHGAAWIQPQFHFNKIDFFAAAQLLFTSYWRNGLYINGLFPLSSYGRSEAQDFLNYSFKAGLTYKINKHNALYANGAYFTQAPLIGDAFLSPETRNQVASNLVNEQVYSTEAGYRFQSPIVKIRGTFFFTQFNNQTTTTRFFDDYLSTYVNYTLTGVNTRHIGGEASIETKIYGGFSATAIASLGRYIYTSRPLETITSDNNATIYANNETVYLKNFNVSGSPQMAYSLELSYHSKQFWFVDLYFNYYDWMWVEVNPARRTVEGIATLEPGTTAWDQVIDQQKLKGQFTMDMMLGYSWLLNKQFDKLKKHRYFLAFSLNVSNLTNNQNFIVSAYEQRRMDFEFKNINKFPPKITYAYGTNYLFTVAFRMN